MHLLFYMFLAKGINGIQELMHIGVRVPLVGIFPFRVCTADSLRIHVFCVFARRSDLGVCIITPICFIIIFYVLFL